MLTLQRKTVHHNFHFQDDSGTIYFVRWIVTYVEDGRFNTELYLYKATAEKKYQDEWIATYAYPFETAQFWWITAETSERILQQHISGSHIIPMPSLSSTNTIVE